MHIRHTRHQHKDSHYLILLLVMATGFFAFAGWVGFPDKQFLIGIVTGVAYALWGIFHHLYERDLSWKVVVEYVSLSFLGVGMLWILLSNIY